MFKRVGRRSPLISTCARAKGLELRIPTACERLFCTGDRTTSAEPFCIEIIIASSLALCFPLTYNPNPNFSALPALFISPRPSPSIYYIPKGD